MTPDDKTGELLRLADELDQMLREEATQAAAELRRLATVEAERDRMREALRLAEADAARYRWLRDNAVQELQFDHTAHTCDIGILVPCEWDEDPQLDEAIDAALTNEGKTK